MAESASESKSDEMERDNLQKAIAEAETALATPGSGPRPILQTFVQNAKGRVATLDKKIKELATEREQEKTTEVAAISEAQKETALNAKEREAYGGFLKEDFFTKKDFGRLEEFYSKSWNRLSDSGKDQMSHRFWEGIRRNEYEFKDAPEAAQEKEAKRAYTVLKDRQIGAGDPSRIPISDRDDFTRAYERGDRDEAGKILNRESFKENMFREGNSPAQKHAAVEKGQEAVRARVEAAIAVEPDVKGNPPKAEKSGAGANADVSGLIFGGVKMVDAPATVSSADIPNAAQLSPKTGPSLGGG